MDRAAVEDLFAPLGAVAVQRMFGGLGIRLDGLFFAIVVEGEVCLKADEETQPAFRDAGSTPFVYRAKGKPVEMGYWRLPLDAYEDEESLRRWGRLALEAARRAHSRKPPGRRKAGLIPTAFIDDRHAPTFGCRWRRWFRAFR